MAYKIGPGCSTCHSCYFACPVQAIGFVDSEYAIDENKCIHCGTCARVCPTGLIYDPSVTPAVQAHEPVELEADLVVCGGGGAGLTAAVHFAQRTGGRVVLLEKGKRCGGDTNLSHGFAKSARWSRLHEAAGAPDLREEFVEKLMSTHPDFDRKLLRDAQYALCDMLEMLFDLGGYEELFNMTTMPFGPDAGIPFVDFPKRWKYNVKSDDHSMGPGWQSSFAVDKLLEEARRLGVRVLTEHRAAHLLTDASGAITGVEAEDPGGRTVIHAPACILATGGFSHSREKMAEHYPSFFEDYPVHSFTVHTNTGDAIDMIQEIGGAMDWSKTRVAMFGPTHHPFRYGMVRLVEQPEIVRVDKNGRRFMNEAVPAMDLTGPMEKLPGHYGWAIMDTVTARHMGDALVASAFDPEIRQGYENWAEQLEGETAYNRAACKGETLEELAEKMGADPAVFTAEIARYNAFCAAGRDEDFGKDPAKMLPIRQGPFYACFIARFNENTMGGIVNDSNLNVLRTDGSPIPGLYAVGDTCVGLYTEDFMDKFGDCAWAMASGYLSADRAAEFLGR